MIHLEEIKVRDGSASLQNGNAHNNKRPETEIREESGKSESCDSSGFCDNFFRCHRFVALLIKNFIRIWRNIGFLLFQFLIPIIQVCKRYSAQFFLEMFLVTRVRFTDLTFLWEFSFRLEPILDASEICDLKMTVFLRQSIPVRHTQ